MLPYEKVNINSRRIKDHTYDCGNFRAANLPPHRAFWEARATDKPGADVTPRADPKPRRSRCV